MSEEYLEMIEQAFERQFGLHGVRAEYSFYIPHQVNLKVKLPVEPTPEMKELGCAIEAEHAELDQLVWVHVVRDRGDSWLSSGWKALSRRLAA